MKYVRRLVWLAAWSVWAWLGVGLYRELPRTEGAPLSKLSLEKGEWIDRLVVGTSLAISRSTTPDGERVRRVWDLRSGELSVEPLDAREDAKDRDFLKQRGPLNEREDMIEVMERLVERVRSVDGWIELHALDNVVTELATGRVIDAGCRYQRIVGAGPFRLEVSRTFEAISGANAYGCIESWCGVVGGTTLNEGTFAIHSLMDGRLLYRVRHPIPWMTSNGALSLHANGAVYALPPPPNWRWLVVCQAVLALPLVMLWGVLRLRRARRRKAMEEATTPGAALGRATQQISVP